jgi:hypothetical protein
MEQITVIFQKHDGSAERAQNILLDEPLSEYLEVVLTLLGLSDTIKHQFVLSRSGSETELSDNQTFREAGIKQNDKLVLYPLKVWQENNDRGSVSSQTKAVPVIDTVSSHTEIRDSETSFSPNNQPQKYSSPPSSDVNNWQKPVITGSVIGVVIIVGLVATRSPNPLPSSSPSISQAIPNSSSSIVQEEAVNLVNAWLKAKRVMFAPPYNRQIAADLITGGQYEQVAGSNGSIDWLKSNNAYYKFGVQKIDGVDQFVASGEQATLQVKITEDRTLYKNGQIDPNETDFKTRVVVYNLQRINGRWKIASTRILN